MHSFIHFRIYLGAGAFEVAANVALKKYLETVKGRARLGIQVEFVMNVMFIVDSWHS